MKTTNDTLKNGAPCRLKAKRNYATKMQSGTNGHYWAGKTWRDFAYIQNVTAKGDATRSRAIRGEYQGALFADSFALCGFEHVGPVGDILRNAPLGYYIDDFCGETVRAHVVAFRVPSRMVARGACRVMYCAAVDNSDSDGVTVWPVDYYAEKEDAARAADGIAERIAENERDYRAADDAQQLAHEKVDDARDAIAGARAYFHRLAADYKKSVLSGAVCELLRTELAKCRKTVADNVRELPALLETARECRVYLDILDARNAATYPAAQGGTP